MQEAWLLFDEAAIREASDNPNGEERMDLPALSSLEEILDPKELLRDLLRVFGTSSGQDSGPEAVHMRLKGVRSRAGPREYPESSSHE
jgi:hypothetical protein